MNLLITSDLFSIGGFETHIQTFIKYLYKQRNKITFISHFPKGIPTFLKNFCEKIIPLESAPTVENLEEYAQLIKSVLESKPFDFVHAHPFYAYFSTYIAASELNVPMGITIHGENSIKFPFKSLNFFLKELISKETLTFTVNPTITLGNKDIYLPNPIDTDFWRPSSEKPQKEYILLVSRLDKEKLESIVKFLNRLPKSERILIAGEGTERKFLQKKFKYVSFLGKKNGNELKKLMKESKFVVGMGRVVLEALFIGKPVVVLGYKGNCFVIKDEKDFAKAAQSNFNGNNLPDNPNFLEEIRNFKNPVINSLEKFDAFNVIRNYTKLVQQYIKLFETYQKSHWLREALIYSIQDLKLQSEELRKHHESIKYLKREIENQKATIENLKLMLKNLQALYKEEKKYRKHLLKTLDSIYSSKSWKLIQKYYSIKSSLKMVLTFYKNFF